MTDRVREMYDAIAASYDKMVDAEIEQPVYTEALGRLAAAVRELPGPVVDVACGSGQMLQRYRAELEPARPLVGIDLSPAMVEITAAKLTDPAEVRVGDMVAPEVTGAAAVICWFALHHLEPARAPAAIAAWFRALAPGGCLSLATWEGTGLVDYGDAADIEAWRYEEAAVREMVEQAGFDVVHCEVRPVPDMGMSAVYLDAIRRPSA